MGIFNVFNKKQKKKLLDMGKDKIEQGLKNLNPEQRKQFDEISQNTIENEKNKKVVPNETTTPEIKKAESIKPYQPVSASYLGEQKENDPFKVEKHEGVTVKETLNKVKIEENPNINPVSSPNPNNDIQDQKANEKSTSKQENSIDYNNWDVQGWKSRGSDKNEFENAVEKKYNTVLTKNEDGSFEGVVGNQKIKWTFDAEGNPTKQIIGQIGDEEKAEATFNALMETGSVEETQEFLKNNPSYNTETNKIKLRNKILLDNKNKEIQKYSNLSWEGLHSLVQQGKLVPGTETFNALPGAAEYYKNQRQLAIIEADKDNNFDEYNKNMFESIDTMVEKSIGKYFDVSDSKVVVEKYNRDPRMQEARENTRKHQNKITELMRRRQDIEEDVEREMGNASAGAIAVEKSRRFELINKEIQMQNGFIQAEATIIAGLKDDMNAELGILEYEDSMKKEQYNKALNQYNTDRKRMDSFKKLELQEQNKIQSENRAFQRGKELAIFNQELAKEYGDDMAGGVYKDDGKGNLVYVKNGKKLSVLEGLGKSILEDQDSDYKYETYSKDGVYTTIGIPKKKGLSITYDVKDMNGKSLTGGIKIQAALDKARKKGQCGAMANDYTEALGLGRLFKDSWEQKKGFIEDGIVPKAGDIAIFNPNGGNPKYGHVAVVKMIKGDKVLLEHNNWNNDEKRTQDWLPLSMVESTGGFMSIGKEEEKEDFVMNDKQTTFYNQMVSKFRGDPMVKTYESALASSGDLVISLQDGTGAGDMAAIFQFMKTLDPQSVVRESEFELAATTAGVQENVGVMWAKIKSGEKLSEKQRKSFKKLALAYVKNKGRYYDIKYNDMERALQSKGIAGGMLPSRMTTIFNGNKKEVDNKMNPQNSSFRDKIKKLGNSGKKSDWRKYSNSIKTNTKILNYNPPIFPSYNA